MWKSKAQIPTALSSAEAEFYALADASKDLKFIIQVLETVGIEVEKPVEVFVDNIVAIFMSANNTATSRTRHIDARYHFVRDMIEDKIIKVTFVKSKENKANTLSKNVSSETYVAHTDYLGTKEKLYD